MQEQETLFERKISEETGYQFRELSKWIRLFVILSGLSVLIVIFFLAFKFDSILELLNKQREIVDRTALLIGVFVGGFFILAFAGIMLFFVARAGRRIRNGLDQSSQELFNGGLNDLKTFFVIWGAWGILSLLSVLLTLF